MGKILVIDDSVQQHELVKRAFKRYDPALDVVTVSSVNEGFEIIEHEDVDIIFVDYVLEEMNGVQFLRELKRNAIDIPAVLITARGDERTAVEAIKAGAYEYVMKDIGYFNALPHVYRKAMDEYASRRALSAAHKRILEFNERLLRINTLLKDINQELDTTDTIRRALRGGIDLMGGDGGFICLWSGERLVILETENIQVEFRECQEFPGIAGMEILDDLGKYPPLKKELGRYNPSITILAPIDLLGGIRGMFGTIFLSDVSLDEELLKSFEVFIDALSSAIGNSILFEQVSKSQTLWQATFDAISDILFVVDEHNIVQKCNKAFALDCGLHPRDIVGAELTKVCGGSEVMRMYLERGLNERKEAYSEELTFRDRRYIVSGFPVVFPEGGSAMVNVLKDITEQSRLKEQLFHADKLASLGLLVSGVAHEINNPLTGIVGYTELLQMKVKDEAVLEELNKIARAAERCKSIVENLLTFSRQKAPEKTYAQINDIIDGAIELRVYWLRSSNIDVIRDYSDIPYAYLDPQQIQQVIMNILINAEHALEEVDQQRKIITFKTLYKAEEGKIQVFISDNGPGIPKEILPRIFDPFFTTKPVGKGSGLGLSISHGILRENGATIDVESRPGEGTIFRIEFPVGRKTEPEQEETL